MSSKPQEYMKFISKQNQKIGKDRVHSLSPNVRPSTSKNNYQQNNINIMSNNNLYKNKNLVYNNNMNNNQLQNYNIKVNKSKELQKEKVIEGDLNFNFAKGLTPLSKQNNTINTKNKGKNTRGMPRKSPIPINHNNLKNKNIFFNPLLNKPKTAFGNKNNLNNNKPLTSLNKNKKNINRNHSPLLRTNGNKNKIITINKNVVKPRFISKSPVLGKNSIYNKYKNFGFNKNNNNNFMIKSQNFKKGKINIAHNPYNINNINNLNNITNNQLQQIKKVNNVINSNKQGQQKRQTIITCEYEEANKKKDPKINVNVHKEINNNNKNNNMIKKNIIHNGNNLLNNNEIKTNISIQNKSINNNNQQNKPLQENKKVNSNKNNPIIQSIKVNKNINNDEEKKISNNQEKEVVVDNNKQNNPQNENITDSQKDQTQSQSQSQSKSIVNKKIKDLHAFTHVGFDGEQDKENNQDSYFIQKNFAGHKDYIYMSVCDGHGVNGHHVSNFIKTILPIDMSENLKHRNILTETEKTHEIIKETFIIANDKLVENQEIDSIFSGTTCVSVIFTPIKLICPNIGDSRAVLARYDINKKKYISIDLSRDHKPTESDEKKRIIENDGRIQPFLEDGEFVGPERVWIKEEEVPGLAMTRSFGDRVAATVGVISEPEIKEVELDNNDKFMIIASDGIWEFISSQECVDIISEFYEKNDIKGCCKFLYEESSKRWLKEEEVIDDTTLILVFFE